MRRVGPAGMVGGRRRRGPRDDPGPAVLHFAVGLAGDGGGVLPVHPVLSERADGVRAVDADVLCDRCGVRATRDPRVRGADGLEVLRQSDGQQGAGEAGQPPVHLRRGELRAGRRLHPREGRHLRHSVLAVDRGTCGRAGTLRRRAQ